MQLSLSDSLPRSKTREKPSEKIPLNQSTLTATSFAGSAFPSNRGNSTVDCLTTPCPKCNKRSIVRRSTNTFDCLNCNFHKQLPPVMNGPSLLTPRRIRNIERGTRALSDYSDTPSLDSSGIEGRALGHGSLSRFLETSSVHSTHTEPDTAQPMIFAAIAVIVGILIL